MRLYANQSSQVSDCTVLRVIAMEVKQSYVSVGVNRVVNALDWGPDGLVAYGAHNMVVVYDPEVRDILEKDVQPTAPSPSKISSQLARHRQSNHLYPMFTESCKCRRFLYAST